jgi:hypothetical protein
VLNNTEDPGVEQQTMLVENNIQDPVLNNTQDPGLGKDTRPFGRTVHKLWGRKIHRSLAFTNTQDNEFL